MGTSEGSYVLALPSCENALCILLSLLTSQHAHSNERCQFSGMLRKILSENTWKMDSLIEGCHSHCWQWKIHHNVMQNMVLSRVNKSFWGCNWIRKTIPLLGRGGSKGRVKGVRDKVFIPAPVTQPLKSPAKAKRAARQGRHSLQPLHASFILLLTFSLCQISCVHSVVLAGIWHLQLTSLHTPGFLSSQLPAIL